MGQKLVSKIIFQPPNGLDMVYLNNTHYITTNEKLKIPLLWFPYGGQKFYKNKKKKKKQRRRSQNFNTLNKNIDELYFEGCKINKKKQEFPNWNDDLGETKKKNKNKPKRKKRSSILFTTELENEIRYTILYSHANAESIFQLPAVAQNLRSKLDANVCIYEYCGYPFAEGKCTEKNCYRSGQAALRWLNEEKGIPNSKIILMGHSLGAAVATDLALKNPDVYGLVLLSPFLSCVKVPNIKLGLSSIDMFENWKKAPRVKVKTLFIHGIKDEIVKIKHGKKLYQLFPNTVEPLWIKYAGHNNIEWIFGWKLYPRLVKFIYKDLLMSNKLSPTKI
ncbi:hypothetical protein M0813_00320 [Anaeramoeba flamelloides]|uniref:Phospholipase/carboxylesterase/thioesterase domain-containing protein n=1 Tax=Anaeramoeba flamelloides TaxID=1746091 RepID=A0ABQ8YA05_9EUKA|nr:hypothetical protein M0813_00320 [Anaeramoeba flamelloides]